jgi:hypothetical protein
MPYHCYALTSPVYGPAMRIISAITNAANASVTTTFDHGYVDGTIIRFDIPPALGMQQLNQQTSPIVVTGPTTFIISINTTNFEPFAIPSGLSPHINICGLSVPIGEVNSTLEASVINQLNPTI